MIIKDRANNGQALQIVKEYNELTDDELKILVFKRPGYEDNFPDLPFEYVDMNVDISSTEIREKMRKSFEEFLFDDILDESFTKGFEELLEK